MCKRSNIGTCMKMNALQEDNAQPLFFPITNIVGHFL